jgi:aldose 1-epimerase
MTTKPFGFHPETKEALTLTTVTSKPRGLIEVSFTNIGASIVSWKIGRFGRKKELVLGFDDGASYLGSPNDNPFFGTFVYENTAHFIGATIGRIANRINAAKVKNLNGQDYQLSPTEGENTCHSGPEGFHHRIFGKPTIDNDGNKQIVTYNLHVYHLEDNFPGTINVFVKYTVEEEEKLGGVIAGKLGIEYDVRLLGDAQETAIAMTNHRYESAE